jgi:hypothetical protein
MHLEELKKQGPTWKPHSCNFLTWVFIKINNSQPIDLNVNQIMKSIICHDHMCDLEILPLHMRCHKGLIAHQKTNAIIAIKKHVEVEHKTLLVKYLEHVSNQRIIKN